MKINLNKNERYVVAHYLKFAAQFFYDSQMKSEAKVIKRLQEKFLIENDQTRIKDKYVPFVAGILKEARVLLDTKNRQEVQVIIEEEKKQDLLTRIDASIETIDGILAKL